MLDTAAEHTREGSLSRRGARGSTRILESALLVELLISDFAVVAAGWRMQEVRSHS